MSEPRNVDDVCEALCEASCVDVSPEKCAAIWALMEDPATTKFSLAVVAWERGESHRRLRAQHAALVALLGRARVALAEALMVVGTLDADRVAYGASLLKQVDLARDLGLPTMDSLDAALAGLGGA